MPLLPRCGVDGMSRGDGDEDEGSSEAGSGDEESDASDA